MLRTIRWWAKRVTSENKPKSAGVVRRIAISDHCLCVSIPRCRRASWKVVSICQRKTNHLRICSGSAPRSVYSKAWVAKAPCGSRTSTQRMGTAGSPVEYQSGDAVGSNTYAALRYARKSSSRLSQRQSGWREFYKNSKCLPRTLVSLSVDYVPDDIEK